MIEILSVLLLIFGWSAIFVGLFRGTEKDIDRKREEQKKRIAQKRELLKNDALKYEYVEREYINSVGEWATVGEWVLIDCNEN